ncbi:MAG: TolC family protein [Rikenellaceae bacterium]|nr:TolC family protein [Rikenellaceae bacterium]
MKPNWNKILYYVAVAVVFMGGGHPAAVAAHQAGGTTAPKTTAGSTAVATAAPAPAAVTEPRYLAAAPEKGALVTGHAAGDRSVVENPAGGRIAPGSGKNSAEAAAMADANTDITERIQSVGRDATETAPANAAGGENLLPDTTYGTTYAAGNEFTGAVVPEFVFECPALSVTPAGYLDMVMNRNHGLAAEYFRTAIAEAELKAARVINDPELTFEGSKEVWSLELGYTVEFGRKRGARIRQARTFAEMERQEVELYAAELRLAAAEAYIEAVAEAEMLEVRRSSYEYMLEMSRSDSLRFLAGEITENDARQSSLEARTLLGEVYRQEGDYMASLVVLGFYAGVRADTLLVPTGDIRADINAAPLPLLIERGQEMRTETALANLGIEMARRELAIARSDRKPDVDVFLGYERDWKGLLPRKHMLTGGVTIPLKFSSANKGAVRAATLAVGQEMRAESGVRAEIEAEIAAAYYIYVAALRNYDHYRSGIMEEARRVLDGFVYGYRAGETDILEVLIAQRTYNETREQFIESRKEARLAAVNLQYACGMDLL